MYLPITPGPHDGLPLSPPWSDCYVSHKQVLKKYGDEQWGMGDIVHTLTNRR